MGYPEDRKRSTLPDSDEMPVSLQRQIDTIKNDFQKAVDALNNRIDDAMDHSGLYGVIHALRKRVDGLEADRAAWAADAVKAGAHLKFQKLETRINEAFRRIGNTAGDVTKLLEPIRKEIETINYHLSYREVEDTNRMNELERRLDGFTGHFERKTDGVQFSNQAITGRLNGLEKQIDKLRGEIGSMYDRIEMPEDFQNHINARIVSLEKKLDACWAGQEEVTLRVANYTNALEMAVEAGDALLEKKIDACRVALHNTEKQLYEHALRLAGLDNLCKDHPKDPWKERWESLRAYIQGRKTSFGLSHDLFHVLKEMEALEKGIS